MTNLQPGQVLVEADTRERTTLHACFLVGMTVREAIKTLRHGGTNQLMKTSYRLRPPYKVNGLQVDGSSRRKLRQGDVLSVDP